MADGKRPGRKAFAGELPAVAALGRGSRRHPHGACPGNPNVNADAPRARRMTNGAGTCRVRGPASPTASPADRRVLTRSSSLAEAYVYLDLLALRPANVGQSQRPTPKPKPKRMADGVGLMAYGLGLSGLVYLSLGSPLVAAYLGARGLNTGD